ncbi:DUF3300 domain-containing protein [Variovorax ginsengisoli]|uniref:DUF3300 domain-containing protein n=1 Tax=Variovorax ginsengisoli TaxID=363844 RepID=A0ABT8S5K6_9BURK|nr:DUF3300 domain-containing protein [Variovorax ginsengisoli]MDN8615039.1 DUF3300 domain-containing protein [Variovorax ginsengisoli]MDO1534209.1 DUF3300 domain-containing protein [Variovorax ginsengisoli]
MFSVATRFTRMLAVMVSLLVSASLVTAQQAPTFSREQLDQMMAPIALYPDSLLSQVLMAATYPADVVDAAKWSKANSKQQGDAAVKAVQDKPWDPSVQSLVAFPQVIQMMGDQPDWTQNLGDAFLASSKDVLDSAQRLRTKAQQQGSLKTTEQQKVIVEQEPQTQQTVIKIEPANPEVVYVPAYNPTVVYGAWPYPAYPPYYYPPYPAYYPGAALATGIAFGVGVAAVGALWGNANWGGGNVNVNVNRYNSINTNRQIAANQTNFQHNAANRKGVPYRDSRSQQQYGRNAGDPGQRQDYRGRDNAGRDAQRQQAQSSLQQRGMDPGQGRENLRNDPGTRERAQQAVDRGGQRGGQGGAGDRGGQGGGFDRGGAGGREQVQHRGGSDNALRGAGDGGAQARQQADRGNASRQSMGGAGGGGAHAGAGARAGGGGYGGGGAHAGGGARPSGGSYGGGHAGGGARAGGGGGGMRGGGGGGGRGGGGRR